MRTKKMEDSRFPSRKRWSWGTPSPWRAGLVGSTNSIENSLDTDKITKPETGAPDTEVCLRLIRDFPNTLDNHNICKVKEAGQFLNWLREVLEYFWRFGWPCLHCSCHNNNHVFAPAGC